MSPEAVAGVTLAAVTMLALIGGAAIRLLTMHIDHRIRRQLDKANETYMLGQRTIALNQEANGRAIARIAAKIDNGVSQRLARLEAGIDSLTRHLLDE